MSKNISLNAAILLSVQNMFYCICQKFLFWRENCDCVVFLRVCLLPQTSNIMYAKLGHVKEKTYDNLVSEKNSVLLDKIV